MSLSGRVGTGNIAGVATAITFGGPGAVFWMWAVAFLGSGTAYVESALAQIYKEERRGQLRGAEVEVGADLVLARRGACRERGGATTGVDRRIEIAEQGQDDRLGDADRRPLLQVQQIRRSKVYNFEIDVTLQPAD